FKVFGRRPEQALELVDQGLDKETIFERTGQTVAIRDASFEVRPGEVFVVMGLSGSGKSTLLRMVNRIIEPTSGTVRVAERDVTQMSRKELRDLRRNDLTMVFQSFALMPHQRVWENAAFGLDVAGVSRHERRERAQAALDKVGLGANAESYPAELSGGMQQRVGLARALAAEPKILLMDEAFSALDPLIRTEMQDELIALQREQELTVIFISHDLDEAMRIGHRIAIMEGGGILQVGTPEEILQNPANEHVRSFFGGVDISNVYTAGDIAAPEKVVVTPRGDGLRVALQVLRRHERDYGYARDAEGRLLGVISIDSLLKALRAGSASLEDAFIEAEPLRDDTPFDEVVARLAHTRFPLPVVDDDGRLLGTITKSRLLETLETRGAA
ncbi:MAG: glycine betaine/L-proline ABC transporter ATP-binding protein ProV, partial [Polyangiales bacterium]